MAHGMTPNFLITCCGRLWMIRGMRIVDASSLYISSLCIYKHRSVVNQDWPESQEIRNVNDNMLLVSAYVPT